MKVSECKRLLAVIKLRALFIFLNVIVFSFATAQNNQDVISTVRQLEMDWHHAYVTHDSSVLIKILADDFINLGRTGGRATKRQVLENFKKDSAVYEYCEPFDFEFRVFPNTVIVLCKSKEKGMDNGKVFSNVYFSYDVFVKRQKKWQCVQAGVNLVNPN